MAYLTPAEEKRIRKLLDKLVEKNELYSDKKETYFSGFYVDRLWYKILEKIKIPLIAFEIEKGIPSNERLRKDILNIVWTRVPLGYIILPHKRILTDPEAKKGSTWPNWYKSHFFRAFKEYRAPFIFYCDIKIIDVDKFLTSRSLSKSLVLFKD
jgi:hypothetical protein